MARKENDKRRTFGVIILAAGYSSRMKAFKPLLPIGGKTALGRLVETSTKAGISRIMVVTGHNREAVRDELARFRDIMPDGHRLEETYNDAFDDGMFSSIQRGLARSRVLWPDAAGFFLMPVDCPLISSAVLEQMMEAADGGHDGGCVSDGGFLGGSGHQGDFLVPAFEGKKGHPLFIPMMYVAEICRHDGTDGLKGITDKYWERIIRIPVDEEGCVLDMDTQEGYREIEAFLRGGCQRQDIRALAAGRRIFLVRHGETRQHTEKMFIGRYDVPLSEAGKEGAKEMARQLAAVLLTARHPAVGSSVGPVPIRRIYTSPLQRALQTAEILQEILPRVQERQMAVPGNDGRDENGGILDLQLHPVKELREISLGDWDGRRISEIKEKYPEAYQRRGEDIFSFKIGNGSENFYDVQYRAVKALRGILQEDDASDIILVAHSAVIRALENNLKGLRVDDPWEKLDKGSFTVVSL